MVVLVLVMVVVVKILDASVSWFLFDKTRKKQRVTQFSKPRVTTRLDRVSPRGLQTARFKCVSWLKMRLKCVLFENSCLPDKKKELK